MRRRASTGRCARCAASSTAASGSSRHALHVYMLHAPDFLGYESAIHMAADHADVVKKALELKKIGNDLVTLVGGREIHPINVKVGGFYRVPTRRELAAARGAAEARARPLARGGRASPPRSTSPTSSRTTSSSRCGTPTSTRFNEGRIVSSKGLDIPVSEYEDHFIEEHVAHANALHSVHKGHGAYHVGPLARYSLNFDRLPEVAQEAARAAGLGTVCRNPFKSIVVRAVELVFACHEALRIIDGLRAARPPRGGRRARARHRPRRLRGAARDALPPLPHRRDGPRAGGEDRPAHRAEPEDDRERPLALRADRRSTCRRTSSPGSASRPSATTTPASPARRTS